MARRPRYRPWQRGARGQKGRAPLLISVLLGVGLALLCIRAFDAAVRPVVINMAQAKIRNTVTGIVDKAVERTLETEAIAYSDIVTLQTNREGRVTAMTTSTIKLNSLRVEILQDVLEQIECLDSAQLGVPVGSLTGLVYASEWGPLLPVRVLSAPAVDGAFRNEFASAGINQTLHRVMLDVDVEIKLLIPGSITEAAVHTSVCLAETVIVGETPQAYLQAGQ